MKQNTGSDDPVQGDPVAQSLSADDEDLKRSWRLLHDALAERFGEVRGIEGILFLIGIQETGRGYEPRLRKERKQDLIMFGTHCVFETLGIYRRVGVESDEVQWERQIDVPKLDIEKQEKLLRVGIIRYFSQQYGLDLSPVDVRQPDPGGLET